MKKNCETILHIATATLAAVAPMIPEPMVAGGIAAAISLAAAVVVRMR